MDGPNPLAELAAALDRSGVTYMVIGGQAVLVYGEPRMTRDLDITLGVGPSRLKEILALVAELGWRPLVADPAGFVRRTWVLPCEQPGGGLRLDLMFSSSPYEQTALARARVLDLDGQPVRFAAPEDLILHKLFAARPRDLEDVAGILRKPTALDLDYLRVWLTEFDRGGERAMTAAFERLWRESRA